MSPHRNAVRARRKIARGPLEAIAGRFLVAARERQRCSKASKAPRQRSGFPRSVSRARIPRGGFPLYLTARELSLLIFPEIRIKLPGQAGHYAQGARTSGGNISNSHLPGLSPNFIPGISKPRDERQHVPVKRHSDGRHSVPAEKENFSAPRIDFRVASRRVASPAVYPPYPCAASRK